MNKPEFRIVVRKYSMHLERRSPGGIWIAEACNDGTWYHNEAFKDGVLINMEESAGVEFVKEP